jgi:archaeosine-15-forming tRNA-guanine transglycosylase
MKVFAAVVAALLIPVGAANAGEIVINPKASDHDVVLTIRGGKVVKMSVVATPVVTVDAANTGEIVINPKASDRDVVLTIRGGKLVKASVIAKPEPMAKLDHLEDTPAFARQP